jgi:hypothetical protein
MTRVFPYPFQCVCGWRSELLVDDPAGVLLGVVCQQCRREWRVVNAERLGQGLRLADRTEESPNEH